MWSRYASVETGDQSVLSVIIIAALVLVGTPVWGAIGFTVGLLWLSHMGKKIKAAQQGG